MYEKRQMRDILGENENGVVEHPQMKGPLVMLENFVGTCEGPAWQTEGEELQQTNGVAVPNPTE